jgi:hypothetical protein
MLLLNTVHHKHSKKYKNSEGMGLPVEYTSSNKDFKPGKYSAVPNKLCSIIIHQIVYSVCNKGCFYTSTTFRLVKTNVRAAGSHLPV